MKDENNLTWEEGLKSLREKLVFNSEEEMKEFLKPSNNDIPIEEVFSEEMLKSFKEDWE